MEHIPEILKALAEYGLSPVWLILLAMLYIMGVNTGAFPKFWKSSEERDIIPKWAQPLFDKSDHLVDHYNHSTTGFHEETHKKLDTLIEKEDIETKERAEMRASLTSIHYKLDNLKEYGVKLQK